LIEKLSYLTSAQIRAGRALVRISAEKLAELAGLGITTIHRAEAAEGMPSMTRANMDAVRRALEAAGVRFTEDGGVAPAS
jgi:hypothetical protein